MVLFPEYLYSDFVNFLQLFFAEYFLVSSGSDHSVVHQYKITAMIKGLVEVVNCHYDRNPRSAQLSEQLEDLVLVSDVEIRSWFVKQDDFRLLCQAGEKSARDPAVYSGGDT